VVRQSRKKLDLFCPSYWPGFSLEARQWQESDLWSRFDPFLSVFISPILGCQIEDMPNYCKGKIDSLVLPALRQSYRNKFRKSSIMNLLDPKMPDVGH
jgi:hypothetical protein